MLLGLALGGFDLITLLYYSIPAGTILLSILAAILTVFKKGRAAWWLYSISLGLAFIISTIIIRFPYLKDANLLDSSDYVLPPIFIALALISTWLNKPKQQPVIASDKTNRNKLILGILLLILGSIILVQSYISESNRLENFKQSIQTTNIDECLAAPAQMQEPTEFVYERRTWIATSSEDPFKRGSCPTFSIFVSVNGDGKTELIPSFTPANLPFGSHSSTEPTDVPAVTRQRNSETSILYGKFGDKSTFDFGKLRPGSEPKQLLSLLSTTFGYVENFSFSPNGEKLVFRTSSGPESIPSTESLWMADLTKSEQPTKLFSSTEDSQSYLKIDGDFYSVDILGWQQDNRHILISTTNTCGDVPEYSAKCTRPTFNKLAIIDSDTGVTSFQKEFKDNIGRHLSPDGTMTVDDDSSSDGLRFTSLVDATSKQVAIQLPDNKAAALDKMVWSKDNRFLVVSSKVLQRSEGSISSTNEQLITTIDVKAGSIVGSFDPKGEIEGILMLANERIAYVISPGYGYGGYASASLHEILYSANKDGSDIKQLDQARDIILLNETEHPSLR